MYLNNLHSTKILYFYLNNCYFVLIKIEPDKQVFTQKFSATQ